MLQHKLVLQLQKNNFFLLLVLKPAASKLVYLLWEITFAKKSASLSSGATGSGSALDTELTSQDRKPPGSSGVFSDQL